MAKPEKQPRKRIPASERRQLILEEARAAFLEAGGGVAAVSARTIAKRCGIDEALIYRHFGTKEELYFEAVLAPVEVVFHELAAGVERVSTVEVPADQVQREWNLTYDLVLGLCSVPGDVLRAFGMLLFGERATAAKFYGSTLGPALRRLESLVEGELPNWPHRDISPPVSVRATVATCFWIVVESDLAGQEVDRESTARYLTDLLIYGMSEPAVRTRG